MIRSFGPLAIILAIVAAVPAGAQQAAVVMSDQPDSVGLSLTIPGAGDAAAIAAATSGAALGDAVIGQVLVGNTVTQTNIASLSAIDQSINDNVGIIDVN